MVGIRGYVLNRCQTGYETYHKWAHDRNMDGISRCAIKACTSPIYANIYQSNKQFMGESSMILLDDECKQMWKSRVKRLEYADF